VNLAAASRECQITQGAHHLQVRELSGANGGGSRAISIRVVRGIANLGCASQLKPQGSWFTQPGWLCHECAQPRQHSATRDFLDKCPSARHP
jgi:hypothetical protein